MQTFSQRLGLKPVLTAPQVGSMNDDLRNSLWNVLDLNIWSGKSFLFGDYGKKGDVEVFSRTLWVNYLKEPVDTIPDSAAGKLDWIRGHYFACTWNEVYDLLEFIVRFHSDTKPRLAEFLNVILARELAGYKFIDGKVVPITDVQESAMLTEALADTTFAPVTAHLKRSLELLADRKNPDYRNSIKESISAVEAMARIAAGTPKATLGDALKLLEKKEHLHPALKEGFSKLYGYTSDESGIRHAMLDEPNIDQSDAKYFLLSCTSFINYLKANIA